MKEELFKKEFFIARLIKRKLCTTLSTEEATTLAMWEAESPSHQQLVADLTNIYYLQATLPAMNKFNVVAGFERVTAMIQRQGRSATTTTEVE
ncbi:hypothetical protein [Paraflavitalea pollutisoli]|uniref:hypothetical protein n=1 Tax=Paraflavitalea pollutisoli TaxID=3034143 RepID=UPI0023EDEABF|nr:hypothetical protein [Paraflavitalea sp. H1-2-19X]